MCTSIEIPHLLHIGFVLYIDPSGFVLGGAHFGHVPKRYIVPHIWQMYGMVVSPDKSASWSP